MTKKDMPAAKSATASGMGAQGVQSLDGANGAQGEASTSGQEAASKAADTTGTNGSMSTDAGISGKPGADLVAAIASSVAVVPGDLLDQVEGVSVPGLQVVARYDGFRRAGRAWSTQPTVVRQDELTLEQIWQLEDEPCLRVLAVDITPGMDGDDK